MNIKFLSSYDRSFDKLSENVQSEVADIEEELISSLETGAKPSKGLGLKKLKKAYWEARIDLKLRILFRLKMDLLVFVLIGNHDEIRKYLRDV
ncbi:MAG: hypothetical protein QME81_14975 [bacterium]|nr:hypothetical protein [bacterium]